jgi:hypothetical protein
MGHHDANKPVGRHSVNPTTLAANELHEVSEVATAEITDARLAFSECR